MAWPDQTERSVSQPRPLRIAFIYDLVYPFSKGGVERRVWDLATGLADRGHEVHVFGTKMWPGPDSIVKDDIIVHGVRAPARLYSRRGQRSVRQAVWYAIRLWPRVWREQFDVIDVQSMAPLSALVALAQRRIRRHPKCVVTWHEVWGDHWRQYLGTPLGYLGAAAERLVARLADHHIVVSKRTGVRARDALQIVDADLIEGGLDLALVDNASPGSTPFDVCYLGRLDRHKRVDLLLDAVAQLESNGRTLKVLVVGDGPLRRQLREQSAVSSTVEFAGPIDNESDVLSMIKASRLFVSPSVREGFGLTVLEAMGCGVPPIVSKSSDNAAADLVSPGHNGLVVAPNVDEFARAIESLLDDEDLRSRMATNARSTAGDYPISASVRRTQEVYQLAIGKSEPGKADATGA